jgi:hypothetical protein
MANHQRKSYWNCGRNIREICYLEFEALIWIVAIAHGKRKPDYWNPHSAGNGMSKYT